MDQIDYQKPIRIVHNRLQGKANVNNLLATDHFNFKVKIFSLTTILLSRTGKT